MRSPNLQRSIRLRLLATAILVSFATLVTCLASGPESARAQAQAPTQDTAPSTLFADQVDVRVVNVEAVVTRRGDRVEGLGQDSFVLEVDGREVPIEYFTEVRQGVAVDVAVDEAGGGAVPAWSAGEPVATRYLVFVDDYFSIGARRDQVLRRLRGQVDQLSSADRMAIVAYDGRGVELLTSWTRDEDVLQKALRQAADRPAYGLQRRSEWSRLQDTLGSRAGGSAGSSFSSIGFRGARRVGQGGGLGSERVSQVSRVAMAASSALRGFARPDGRKVMLLLSGGLPAISDAELASLDPSVDSADDFGRWGRLQDVRRLLGPLVDTANRLGYTIYPVDLGASFDTGLPDASSATLGESLLSARVERQEEWLAEDALYHLADATGGEAFLDSSRFVALRRAADDTRSYYWLGFVPDWRQDDRIHRVEVKVRGGGLRVRSRTSFSDLSADSLATMEVESAHIFDALRTDDETLEVRLGAADPLGPLTMHVPLEVRLPLDRLALLPSADGWSGRAEIRVAASDTSGRSAPIPVFEVDLRAERAPRAGDVQVFTATLVLRREEHDLTVAVHDPVTGAFFGRRLEVEP